VITGQRSADWGTGAFGPALAHFLGMPHVSSVVSVTARESELAVEHLREGEVVSLSVRPPALLAVARGPAEPLSDSNELRAIEVMNLKDCTLRIPKLAAASPSEPAPVTEHSPALLASAEDLLAALTKTDATH
jgi:electron transfer flavoprotein alpha/beta subunit